ncbi:dimethylaniline monooxygenase [N-oxide-forming] 5-like [Sarcophilus harrisii]|uniref:dimethylaniline monooxygenase [N-oxide-forming] 5-like n=1 Tax=Sarcophilus harrisii TaxID=9305 RepID=UPI00062BCFC1|nr:dimethylaniline monooxygenase [N-oxide-forming] 5-like [Sarcophilus harrisii]
MTVKKIAIIGAGVSGLGAIKSCLEEGLEPTCFEESFDIGGVWRYEEKSETGKPSIYQSVTTNSSKEMTSFSDYPFPDHYPNFLHNSKMMDYVRMYAKHFDLLKYIHFLSKVSSIRKCSDFSSTGQWNVVVEVDGKQETYIFDGIMICNGHYSDPHLPLECFPGIKKFTGSYFHNHEYKNPEKFKGKRVLVIGLGNTGADVSSELSHVAQQVFLSTRRGSWIWYRVWDNGNPLDTVLFTHFKTIIKKCLNNSIINKLAEDELNTRFDHAVNGLLPLHRFLNHQPTFSDDLPSHIIAGRLLVKANVKEFTETTAIFEDDTEESIDVVIFATGYTFSFPFLDNDSTVLDSQQSLFKYVFPPQLEKPTLAFIGIIQPVGATIPTSEMQSRWATRVFKGLNKLPSMSDMMTEIKWMENDLKNKFVSSLRDERRVQYIEYMDEIALEIGVKPSVLSLFFSDPKLALNIFFGPCTPYQYRLQGPGKWAGAREAILTQRERIIKPLRTRTVSDDQLPFSVPFWLLSISMGLLVVLILVLF